MVDIPADWAQQQYNELAARVKAAGAPLTAENMNRAQLMMAQEARGAPLSVTDFEQTEETQPRSAQTRSPRSGGQGRAGEDLPTPPELPTDGDVSVGDITLGDAPPDDVNPENLAALRGQDRNSPNRSGESVVRRGTVNAAQPIDEQNPEAGMFRPNAAGGRQADETGVDQVQLGLSILSALGPLLGGAAGAGGAATGDLGVLLRNRLMLGEGGMNAGPGAGGAARAVAGGRPLLPSGGGSAAASVPRIAGPTGGGVGNVPTPRPVNPWVARERGLDMAGPRGPQAAPGSALRDRMVRRNNSNRRTTADR